MALYARLLAEMRGNRRRLDRFSRDETVSSGLEAIDATESGTQVTMPEMSSGTLSFEGDGGRG